MLPSSVKSEGLYIVQSTTGFSVKVDKQLIDATKPDQAKEWEKCVVFVMDEMHLREDLVYNKHSGALIGFANIGDTTKPTAPDSAASGEK